MSDLLPAPAEDRLRISGNDPSGDHVDGAWWPRSYRLAAELPGLFAAANDRLGPVALVAYDRNLWTDAPDELLVGGRVIHLLGFTSAEPSTVIVIAEDGHHVALRVISPDTAQESALLTLGSVPRRAGAGTSGAAAARSVAEVARKLAEHEGRNDPERDAEILDWCQDAAAQFDDARIQTFVPILVEHIVNDRIHRQHHAGTAG